MGISSGDYQQQRDFGYRNFLDSYGRRAGQKMDKYNRLAGMAGTGQTQSSDLGQMGSRYGQQAGQGLQGIGNVMGAGIMGGANARQRNLQNLWNIGGQLGSAYLMSDRRLKTDIKKLGTHKGYNTYSYRYKNNHQEYIGVMADEVQKINPSAVKEIEGYLAVNYGAL